MRRDRRGQPQDNRVGVVLAFPPHPSSLTCPLFILILGLLGPVTLRTLRTHFPPPVLFLRQEPGLLPPWSPAWVCSEWLPQVRTEPHK